MVVGRENAPIIVSYGGGTNSTAVLILMKRRGEVPALIMFADTGNEKPGTYTHLETMNAWCVANGFPRITVVRNELPQGLKDGSLYGECIRLGTMPSKLFGYSTCSMKWKVTPQQLHQQRWMDEHGVGFVRHFVGFDADEPERAEKPATVKAAEARSHYESTEYPLIEAGWGRDECIAAIREEGLPQPGKSACFMCPSSRKPEVKWLKEKHPDLYLKAITMERRALAGEGQAPAARVAGLGRHWNWETFAGSDIAAPEVDCGCYDGEAAPEDQLW